MGVALPVVNGRSEPRKAFRGVPQNERLLELNRPNDGEDQSPIGGAEQAVQEYC